MKIGILTYQRAENYGALLQAYALKTYLERQGNLVEIIDYWPQYHENYFKIFSIDTLISLSFRGKVAYIIYTVFSLGWLIKRKRNFQYFMYRYLNLSKSIKYRSSDICSDYDLVIYGSDQIWRKQNLRGCRGYDPWYFGNDNVRSLRKITYAASMGVLNMTEEDRLFMSKMLENFVNLSVRERDLQQVLLSLDRKSILVLDPVFLMNRVDWKKIIPRNNRFSKQKYILFYNLLLTRESVQLAEKVAAHYGYEIREIYKGRDWKHRGKRYVKTAGVEEFLLLIQDAEFVVSNSFHGVAMSIIFEKSFYAVGMGIRSERVLTLLTSLGIEDRYITDINAINYNSFVDYVSVNELLDKLRDGSKVFLWDSLKK